MTPTSTTTTSWPVSARERVVLLVDASTADERTMLEGWVTSEAGGRGITGSPR
jgi:hypothetical protein